MRKQKPKYKYEIGLHVNEIWVYCVEATSKKDAVEKIRDGDNTSVQLCTLSGGVNSRKAKIYKKEKL